MEPEQAVAAAPAGEPGSREAGVGSRTTAWVLRLLIGLVLTASAVGKLLDIPGFVEVLRGYRALPEFALFPVAVAMPVAELALAAWLARGRRLAAAALVSAALHGAYAIWSAVALLRGLRLPNCGCFGVFLKRPLGWHTVVEDVGMIGISLWLTALARRRA